MSKIYEKRIQKGKGRQKKKAIKELERIITKVRSEINPIIDVSLSLMILNEIENRKKKENEKD